MASTSTPAAIRALHVIEPLAAGGAESVVRGLATETRRRGEPVALAALAQSDAAMPLAEALHAQGVEVEEIRCGRRRYLAEIRALVNAIRKTQAQVVHTHVYHADLVGYRAARAADVPVVATVHGFTGGGWKNQFYQWLDRRVLRRFDAVLCVSESVRARVRDAGCDPRIVYLVPNGYTGERPLPRAEAREVLGVPRDVKAVGWVGRLSREKGADLLLSAAVSVPRDTMVFFVGDGPERGRLEAETAAQRRIRFLGARSNAGCLLRAFDALVISSRTEGLPIVLLEAMTAEVPVVSFAVGGIPDVVNDNSAWLAPPGDPAALGHAIRRALESPEEAQRRASQARRILDARFGAVEWLDRIQAVYRKVLLARRGRGKA